MIFDELLNQKKVTESLKYITFVSILIALLGLIFMFVYSNMKIEEAQKRVWLVDRIHGDVLYAQHENINEEEQKISEYKNHVNMFYQTMFTYDQFSYEKNIDRASYLSGNCFKKIKAELDNQHIKNKIVETNMKIYADIDSCFIEKIPNSSNYKGIVFAKQVFENNSIRSLRNLHAKFLLIPQGQRTDKNPHAVIIEDFIEFDTKIIKKEEWEQ